MFFYCDFYFHQKFPSTDLRVCIGFHVAFFKTGV